MEQWQIAQQQMDFARRSARFHQDMAYASQRRRRQQAGGRPAHPLWRAISLAVRLALAVVIVVVAVQIFGGVRSAMDEGNGLSPDVTGETAP